MLEAARTSAAMSFHEAALDTLTELAATGPDYAPAWRDYADLLRHAGRDTEADAAERRAAACATPHWPAPDLPRAPARLTRLDQKMRSRLEKLPDEARMAALRDILFEAPHDVAAMRYLAAHEDEGGDHITAAQLLRRALELAPAYLEARIDYVRLLLHRREWLDAYREAVLLDAASPGQARFRLMRADAAMHMERYEEARAIYEDLIALQPDDPEILAPYGTLLKALGRREDSARCFRHLLRIVPQSGAAYFGLSELKAHHLTAYDVACMQHTLKDAASPAESRKYMAYALGQTLERLKDYAGAFAAYEEGAALCREEVRGTPQAHDPAVFEHRLSRLQRVFTAPVMARLTRAPVRNETVPVFIIGMPRAGSTLVEQILGSHSQVEATRELPVVSAAARRIAMSRLLVAQDVYPERVPELSRAALDAIGQDILRGIGEYRSTSLPYVIDKRPWNWLDAPFLRAVLPQAKFIDIRRAPMAAGFAMFKQLLPSDASFTYDLTHLGRYYRQYAAHMDYLEQIMPGAILRVSYENLVDDTDGEIRRMLAYCGLDFEEACLRFWESGRAVMTPSAEQVRRPIFRSALDQWRHFAPWLGPLREALGDLA